MLLQRRDASAPRLSRTAARLPKALDPDNRRAGTDIKLLGRRAPRRPAFNFRKHSRPLGRGSYPRMKDAECCAGATRWRPLEVKRTREHCGSGSLGLPQRDNSERGDCFHKDKESRWRGGFRRLVLAPRGLTGLLNPYAKSGTRLFQPYFLNDG